MTTRLLHSPFWTPLCAGLLLLLPGASLAARQVTRGVEGYIVHVPSPGDPTLTIEAGYESVTLRVNRQTKVGIWPPPPPGEAGDAVAELEVGRRAVAYFSRNSHVAQVVGVSTAVDVIPVEGRLHGVGATHTVSIQPVDSGTPEPQQPADYTLSNQTRIFLNDLPIREPELPLFVNDQVSVLRFSNSQLLERLRVRLPLAGSGTGTVRSTNPETRQLRVALNTGMADLLLPSGLPIQLGDRTLPFSALQPGDWVRVSYARTQAGLAVALELNLLRILPRTTSARLADVDPAAGTLTLTGPGPDTFQVLPDAPITFEWNGMPHDEHLPEAVTLAQLKASLPEIDPINVQVEYLLRGKTRVATRVITTARLQPPPSPTGLR